MRRRHLVALPILTLLTLAARGDGQILFGRREAVQGSGRAVTETRQIATRFDRLTVKGAANVEITVGPAVSVQVTADDNILPLIETVVRDGALEIATVRGASYSSRLGVRVKMTVPALTGATISGSGDVSITGAAGARLALDISGSGSVSARGQVALLVAEVSGSGSMRLEELAAREADVSVSGSGDMRLQVSDRLAASISGSGDVAYRGSPTVTRSVKGSGSVRAMR